MTPVNQLRLDRRPFLIWNVVLVAVFVGTILLMLPSMRDGSSLADFGIWLASIIALAVKVIFLDLPRLRNMGRDLAWEILMVVPLVNYGFQIWLFFAKPGDGDENTLEGNKDPLGMLAERDLIIVHGQRQLKPLDLPRVRTLIEQGQLVGNDRFWYHGTTFWRRIGTLFPLLQAAGTVIPAEASAFGQRDSAALDELAEELPKNIAINPAAMTAITKPERDIGGAIALYIVAAIVLFAGVMLTSMAFHAERGDSNRTAAGYALIAVVMPMCYSLVYKARKMAARSAYDTLRRDGRKPVLFLRSFADDGQRVSHALNSSVKTAKTEETELVKRLKRLGPVLAIGRPGEELAEIGSSRMYVPHEHWKEVALLVMKHARCIVLKGGDTPGLHWEMTALRQNAEPERVAIKIPKAPKVSEYFGDPKEDKAGNARVYEHFRESMRSNMKVELPESPGYDEYVVFDMDWTPLTLPSSGLLPWFNMVTPPAIKRDPVARKLCEVIQPFS